MRNYFILNLICLFIVFGSFAQTPTILGIDVDGGTQWKGRLFSINNYSSVNTVHQFDYREGKVNNQDGNWCLANNGKYYITIINTDKNRSAIYEYDLDSNLLNIVYIFDPVNFTNPVKGLVNGPNGILYGTAGVGDNNRYGVIYSFNPVTKTVNLVHSFDNQNAEPQTPPLIATNNKIYGIRHNSSFLSGVIYEYDLSNNNYAVVHSFPSSYGRNNSNLIEGSDSCIYGVRESASPNYGKVFKFNYFTGVFSNVYNFDVANTPQRWFNNILFFNHKLFISGYEFVPNGNNQSNSAIFKIDLNHAAPSITSQFNFVDSIHGALLYGRMQLNDSLQIIGTCYSGGSSGKGTYYTIDRNLNSIVVQNAFHSSDKINNPIGEILIKNSSTIVGFYSEGRYNLFNSSSSTSKYRHGLGGIYEFNINNNSISNKIKFGESLEGHVPTNSLIKVGSDKVYWANQRGGRDFSGTIVKYNLQTNVFSKVHDVDSSLLDQINSIILLNNTTLLGIGNKGNQNKIFEYDIPSDSFSIALNLPYPILATRPNNFQPILASNGQVYCATRNGTDNTTLLIFKYDPQTKTSSIARQLAPNNISGISSSFIEMNQKLYCTYRQFSYSGILEFNPVNNAGQLYRHWISPNDINHNNPLTKHSNGKLYGYANNTNESYIFEFDITKSQFNKFSLKAKISDYKVSSRGKFLEATDSNFYFKTVERANYLEHYDTSKVYQYSVSTDSLKLISYQLTDQHIASINNFIQVNPLSIGINENDKIIGKLFPNPASDFININAVEQSLFVEILSLEGKIIKRLYGQNQIDISELPNAFYFIRVQSANQTFIEKLLIAR